MRWTVDFQVSNNVQLMQARAKAANSVFGSTLGGSTLGQQPLYQQAQAPQARMLPGHGSNNYALGALLGSVIGQRADLSSDTEIGWDTDMSTAAAEVSEGITSTFIIPGRQSIKDGEKNHTVVIRDLVLDAKFANICVPKMKDVAYLQANIS
jgi:hypothetical protein